MLCPKNNLTNKYFNNLYPTVIILKSEQYYEPIYRKQLGEKNPIKICKNFEDIKEYAYIIQKYKSHCTPQKPQYNLQKEQLTYSKIRKLLIDEYYPKAQIVDSYNKSIAILTENNTIVPIKPRDINIQIKSKHKSLTLTILESYNDINKLDIDEMYDNLIQLHKKGRVKVPNVITPKPTGYILEGYTDTIKDKSTLNIIALYTDTGRIIPVNNITLEDFLDLDIDASSKIKELEEILINYFPDEDRVIVNNRYTIDNKTN